MRTNASHPSPQLWARRTVLSRTVSRLAPFGLLLAAAACAPIEGEGAESYDLDDAGTLDDKALPSASYQAESRSAQSGCAVAKNHSGYTGTGFVDFGGNGSWIEWNNVSASQAGSYELRFRYANASSGNRGAAILVNGKSVGSVAFSGTGGWTRWSTASVGVSLARGNNTIRVLANTGSGGPNLDRLDVVGGGSGSGGGSSSGSGNLRVKVGSRWVSVGCASGSPRADGSGDRWQIVDRKLRNQNGVYLFCDEGWADGRDCQCSRSSSEAYHAIAQADFNVSSGARKYGNGLTTSLAGRGPMYIFPNNGHEFCLVVGSNDIIENKDGGDDGSHHESTHKGKCNEWCFGDGCP